MIKRAMNRGVGSCRRLVGTRGGRCVSGRVIVRHVLEGGIGEKRVVDGKGHYNRRDLRLSAENEKFHIKSDYKA